MNQSQLNLGVDVGGTNVKVALVDESGGILAQQKAPTSSERGVRYVVETLVGAIASVLSGAGLIATDVHSIGLGVPGTADAKTGTVVYAPNIFWKNVPIRALLQQSINLPVHLAQDTRAATWGEYLVGAAQGLQSVAGVTLGTGIGCGMVFDGSIFHGAWNTAGEFGHQIVEFGGHPCNCGRCGCLEAYAGGLAIMREAKKRIPDLPTLLQRPAEEVNVDDVFQLAGKGHEAARQLTEEVVRYTGVGLVNLINLNSIQMVCLSGGISNAPAELLLDPLVAFVKANVYETIADKVQIRHSALGDNAPVIGAALLHRSFAA